MKRLAPAILSALLLAAPARATAEEIFVNSGWWGFIAPMNSGVLDATSIVNLGFIGVTNLTVGELGEVSPALPFEPSNNRNFTNFNLMIGDPGFRFDYFNTQPGERNPTHAADNFVNGTSVSGDNASVFGATYLNVWASNIVNRGSLAIGSAGLLSLGGENVDLTASSLTAFPGSNAVAGVKDIYWGVDTNFLDAFFTANTVQAGSFNNTMVTNTLFYPFYSYEFFFQNIVLNQGFKAYVQANLFGNTAYIDAVFVANTNAAISTDVRFFGTAQTPRVVRWQSQVTNVVTGEITTNTIYLEDTLWADIIGPQLVPTPPPNAAYALHTAATQHPLNYSITREFPFWNFLAPMDPEVPFDPTVFNLGVNGDIRMTNSAWGAAITASYFTPDPTFAGYMTYSNLPGRFELVASNVLDLTRVRIDGESFLRLEATNHFVGSTNARIVAPYSDINLATTNRSMTIANLVRPTVPRMQGVIECWTARWTNVMADGTGLRYNVTVVDSRLNTEVPSQVNDIKVKSDNLVVSDILNVGHNMLLDTERLTISTNPPGSPTLTGEINLWSGDLIWTPSFPRLAYLTNYGRITSSNSLYLAGARTPPWFSTAFQEPYQAVVNAGTISAPGVETWAKYFEHSGAIFSGLGPLNIRANFAQLDAGALVATNSDLSLTAGSLAYSNQIFNAGRAVNLTVTNVLDDGSLNYSVESITNKNFWAVRDGVNLFVKPSQSSLLATTVSNRAVGDVTMTWAASDMGASAAGFANNAALGRLILDSGFDTLVTFRGSTSPADTTPHALYVDYLELRGYAYTNRDNAGNFRGLHAQSNMKVYFGRAVGADGLDITEKLNGQDGGRFLWVSNYTGGFYSSTNVVYPNGTTNRLNYALVTSRNLDSDGDGIVNSQDASPVPITPLPTLDPLANVTINQDSGMQTVTLTGISAGAGNPAAGLRLTATTSDPLLVPSPVVTYASPSATGTLTFAPAPGASGTNFLIVTVLNSQMVNNTFARTCTVAVLPVNVPPGGGGLTNPPAGPGGANTNPPVVVGNLPRLSQPGGTATNAALPNGFALAKGTYTGLFYEADGVSASSSGFLTLTVNERGRFSGRLQQGKLTSSFSGQFDQQGRAALTLVRRDALPLRISLVLDLGGGDQLFGTVSCRDLWQAEIVADRAVFNSRSNPSPAKGAFTMIIPPDDSSPNGPAGYGFGTIKIDAAGKLSWTGTLADGAKVTQRATLSKDGVWPLYAAPYANGSVVGWIQFGQQTLGGDVIWIKPRGTPAPYANGFTNAVEAVGSRYVKPSGRSPALQMSAGTLSLQGGGLRAAIAEPVSVSSGGQFIGTQLKLRVAAATGAFQGSLLDPDTGAPLLFQGVLIQGGNYGAGFFLNHNLSGQVQLAPAP